MKTTRVIAFLMACLMLAVSFVACAKDPGTGEDVTTPAASVDTGNVETEASTIDENGYLLDELPKLDFGGAEVWYLYDDMVQMAEFFVESENGEAVNDAIWKRNLAVENRLNVKLKFNGAHGDYGNQDVYLKAAQTDVDSGDNLYAIYASYSRTIPYLSMKGFLQDLLQTEYIDIEKPWWPESLTSELTINGKLLMCSGDISTTVLWFMCGIFYNKEMWEENNFGYTLEEIVNKGEWTLDKYIEIVKDFYKDDGDGVVNDTDVFGMSFYNTCMDAFLNYCGVVSITKDESGSLVLNDSFTGERTDTIVTKLGQIVNTKTLHHSDDEEAERKIFYNKKALFLCDGTLAVTNYMNANIEFTYGLIPGPKFDTNQESYITNMRYPYEMYAINSGNKGVEMAAAVLEAQASQGYRSVSPIIFEVTMKSRYAADNEVSKMYDILRDGVCFDLGRIYNYSLGNYYPSFRTTILNGGKGWIQTVKATAKTVKKPLENIMTVYSD